MEKSVSLIVRSCHLQLCLSGGNPVYTGTDRRRRPRFVYGLCEEYLWAAGQYEF